MLHISFSISRLSVVGVDFLLAIEEFEEFGRVRDSYPTYEEGLKNVTEDWESFLKGQPKLAPEYQEMLALMKS